MAWSTPPTFTDGETLTATKLNQLSDGVTYLNGLGAAPAIVAAQQVETVGSGGGGQTLYFWCHRHRHRYLHLRYWTDGGDDIKIYYGATQIFHDGDPDAGDNWITAVDLDAVSGMVAYGAAYELRVETLINANKTMKIRMIAEANTTSL